MSAFVRQLTEQEAKDMYASKVYESWTLEQIASFQLYQDRLCLPFGLFHKAMEKVLGRPVWTHEFAFRDRMTQEFEGITGKPTMQEIIDLLPQDKTIILVTDGGAA